MSLGQDFDSGIIWTTPEAVQFFEEQTQASRTVDELDPAELESLMRFQESASALQAYAHLALELGLPMDAPIADVAGRLHDLDISVDEASDWLVACNYDLDCYRQTMFVELRTARRRVADRRAKLATLAAAVITAAAWFRYGRRRR